MQSLAVFLEGCNKVFEVFGSDVFDAEVIENKGEPDGFGVVPPEAGGVFDGGVPVGCKVFL